MATEVYGPPVAAAIKVENHDLAVEPQPLGRFLGADNIDQELSTGQLVCTSNVDGEYILDLLSLTFSTPVVKRVLLRSQKGVTVFDSGMTTDQDMQVVFHDAFDRGDNLTLTITQTDSTCVVNGEVVVRPGAILPLEYSIKQRIEDILAQLTDQSADPKTVVEFLALIYQALAAGAVTNPEGEIVTTKPVKLTFGSVSGVAPGSADIVAQVVANNYAFKGFNATGDGNGYFYLEINGLTILSGNIHTMERNLGLFVQGAYPVQNGITITLRVRNESESLCNFEGVIIGE